MVAFDPTDWPEPVANLRALASEGRLASVAQSSAPAERLRLTGAAFALAWPIVFNQLTRVYERRRGHAACAVAVDRLADGCLDRFYDDVEAVVDDLLTHSTTRIVNPEGWITSRLKAVTIDAHRRRRGARGALQRPRLPGWLVQRLPNNAWYRQLAVEILIWVGVPTTAGTQLWPLHSWTELRATVTGDPHGSDPRTVQREVDCALSAMRTRPQWYDDYIERPLRMKTPPLAPNFVAQGAIASPPELMLTAADDVLDSRLADLATLALAAIEEQVTDRAWDQAAIGRIITTVFGRIDTSGDFAQASDLLDGRPIEALVDDPGQLDRIVGVVCEILRAHKPAAR